MKIIKHGNPEYINNTEYDVECPNCGCEFLFGRKDFISQEQQLYGSAIVRCPDCGQLIEFLPHLRRRKI